MIVKLVKLCTCFLLSAMYSSGVIYYASPDGDGNGKSIKTPCTIFDFWKISQPGDTLFLLDGKYTNKNSMIHPPSGKSGVPGKPITIMALHDGKVDIDGRDSLQPVAFNNSNSFFVLEGFNAHNSGDRDVVSILNSSNNNQIKRICAWDGPNTNSGIFGVHGSEYTLFEDCAGWGIARKIFHNSQGGNHTTYRRCWGQWEYLSGFESPKMTYSTFYNSNYNLFENCIGTWNSKQPGPKQTYGIFSDDHNDVEKNVNCKWLGCIAYLLADQKCEKFDDENGNGGLFHFAAWSGNRYGQMLIKDCIAYVDPSHSNIRCYHLRRGTPDLLIENCTAIGGAGIQIDQPWVIKNIFVTSTGTELISNKGNILDPSINRINKGATVLKRYKNGVLTNKELWPWPMNMRIMDALKISGRPAIDVTETIFGLAGGRNPFKKSDNKIP